MSTSEAVTRHIRVRVESEYSPERSSPRSQRCFILYAVTITDEGDDTVQLMTRHWIITGGNDHVEEVRGPGVVGEQPVLGPGESFTYTSSCSLPAPNGMMEGTDQMVARGGDGFDARIAPFTLDAPHAVH